MQQKNLSNDSDLLLQARGILGRNGYFEYGNLAGRLTAEEEQALYQAAEHAKRLDNPRNSVCSFLTAGELYT